MLNSCVDSLFHFLANYPRQFCFDVNKSSYQIELPKFVFSCLVLIGAYPKDCALSVALSLQTDRNTKIITSLLLM